EKALLELPPRGLFAGGQRGTRTPDLYDVSVILALSCSVLECPRVPSQRAFRHFRHSVRVRLCASFSGTLPRKCRAPIRSPQPPFARQLLVTLPPRSGLFRGFLTGDSGQGGIPNTSAVPSAAPT